MIARIIGNTVNTVGNSSSRLNSCRYSTFSMHVRCRTATSKLLDARQPTININNAHELSVFCCWENSIFYPFELISLNALSLSVWWSSKWPSLWLSSGIKCRLQCQIQWNLFLDLFAPVPYFQDINSFHAVCLFVKTESLVWMVKAVIPFRFIHPLQKRLRYLTLPDAGRRYSILQIMWNCECKKKKLKNMDFHIQTSLSIATTSFF